ncbi:hypothetical protein D3C81_1160500 [compost metagenome]
MSNVTLVKELEIRGVEVDKDDLYTEIEDMVGKLNSIVSDIENGRPLDETQHAFLKMHNVI